MSRCISVTVSVTIPDDVDPEVAGESLFDTLCEHADDAVIESVDGWEPR